VPERDANVERLERELGEQRALATTLREWLDAAAFKMQVLEKSYAKQLADTREKLAAKERELADKLELLAGLDGGHEHALHALKDARAELQRVTAERDQLRTQIGRGGARQQGETATRAPLAVADVNDAGTINALIASVDWAEKRKPGVGEGHANAQVAEQDAPPEEMLSPELVFTRKDKVREDDER
jgi:chromosome segregation ATPase